MSPTMAFFVGMIIGSIMGTLSVALAVIAKQSEEDYFLVKMNKEQADHWNANHWKAISVQTRSQP